MGLKSEVATPHSDTVGFNKKLPNSRHKQPAQDFEVPVIRLNVIKIVVRICLARVENRIEYILDIRDVELGASYKRVCDTIDRSKPPVRILRGGMALLQGDRVFLEIPAKFWELVEIDEPVGVPWVNKIMPGPVQSTLA
ncbi:MAG: hypothetical protein LAO79_01180 [Acidobacteriia bacterium]|nr:hypothetical protein [Terriglobia bacterium]